MHFCSRIRMNLLHDSSLDWNHFESEGITFLYIRNVDRKEKRFAEH